MSNELSETEINAAGMVGKAMLKAMRRTKLPRDAQIRACIHALLVIATMEQSA